MYLLYNVLLGLGLLVLLPKFVLDAWRHGKYVAGLWERLGFVENLIADGHPVLWLHCVSVGETLAAQPLLLAIRREFPHYRIVVSTVTSTGQNLAQEIFKHEAERVFYFPVDWGWIVRRTLRAIQPSVVLIMETELWPGFLRQCRRHEVPAAIVNGRLSEKSFRHYQLVRPFVSRVVNCLDLAIMQSDGDADRIRRLGLAANRVLVSGNVKFDTEPTADQDSLTKTLATRFDLGSSTVVLAASTHEPEERMMIEAFQGLLKQNGSNPRLVIAPRHPERFGEVVTLLNASGLSWVRRTATPDATDANCQIILLDTIGELRSVFPLSPIVFVGGSIAAVGGHNILEPATVGACIVTGPHTENFIEIVSAFAAAGALVQLPHLSDEEMVQRLTSVLADLLQNHDQRRVMGAHAKDLVEKNRGATARTIEILEAILSQRADPKKLASVSAGEGGPQTA